MSSFDQSSLKRRLQESRLTAIEENHKLSNQTHSNFYASNNKFLGTVTAAAAPSPPLSSSLSSLPFSSGNGPCRRNNINISINGTLQRFRSGSSGRGLDDDVEDDDILVSTVVPPVTVVLEGRSICQRISLDKHTSYRSLAKALRQMFVDDGNNWGTPSSLSSSSNTSSSSDFDLSNAIPGHLIAYEDMENDLLLVGDLNWNDFVRVAKRIRIIPVKANSRRGKLQEC